MPDRGRFWSAPPEWATAEMAAPGLRIAAVAAPTIWLASGNLDAFRRRHGVAEPLGPRDAVAGRYALRLAPDRLLHVSDASDITDFGWSPEGYAISDLTDGMILLDLSGPESADVMAQGSGYDFHAGDSRPLESAQLLFANLRLAVARRPDGWRLHVERPLAPTLWRWLQTVVRSGS